MVLSSAQILELLKSPKSKAGITRAINHEDHLRFHGDVILSSVVNEKGVPVTSIEDCPYYTKYLHWVHSILSAPDKFEQFKRLLTFPVKTNEVIDDIADEYMKVFDSQDSFFIPEFHTPELTDDFLGYLESKGDNDFWKSEGFRAMMTSISSILIVDLGQEQTSLRPEPYYYLLDIRRVMDLELNSKGEIEYIIFKDRDTRIGVFDEAYYRVFNKEKDGSFTLLVEQAHDLEYCPARFFWSDVLNKKYPEVKHSPLSALLSRLDWYLFFETAKESLDLYAAYPIYWAYESRCDYKDHWGNACQNGVVNVWNEQKQREYTIPCPVCQSKRIVGPGSLIDKPIPRGQIELDGPPVGIVGIDRESLDYNVSESERLKAQIVTAATGKNKLLVKEAVNEDQMQSQFESQTNVLQWIADNFAKAHKWVWDTVARLRYADQYIGCSISYGTQFYLQTLEDAVGEFKLGKESGIPQYILISKMSTIEHLQSKNNPKEKQRLNILKHLEPYPILTLKECKDNGFDIIDKLGFVLKANFANFVSRFEMDHGAIIEAGSALDLSKRISLIKEVLEGYAQELVDAHQKVIEEQMAMEAAMGGGSNSIPAKGNTDQNSGTNK